MSSCIELARGAFAGKHLFKNSYCLTTRDGTHMGIDRLKKFSRAGELVVNAMQCLSAISRFHLWAGHILDGH